jgi:hypothetical protein
MKTNLMLLATPALLLGAWQSEVQAQAADVKFVTAAPSDAKNFIGDRVNFPDALHVNAVALGSNKTEPVCIAAKTRLRGMGVASIKVLGESEPKEHVLFLVADTETDKTNACNGERLAKEGQTVALDAALLAKVPPDRYGLTYGTLIVPYKYQFRGDRSVAGGATLGGYVGYRASSLLFTSVSLITFAGPTKVDVARLKDGKAETESLAGLSYGVGMLGTVKDSFKAGLVIGTDRVAKSAGYVNNGKAWVSLSLGYDFVGN